MASIIRPSLVRQAVPKLSIVNRPLAQQLRPAFQRAAIPKSTRIAAFHATQRNQILPPLPQKILGTANDPTPVPDPDYAHGSYHWSFERWAFMNDVLMGLRRPLHVELQIHMLMLGYRIVSAGIVPLTLAPFAAGSLNPVTDSIFCALLVIHSHIGFEYVYSLFFGLRSSVTIRRTNNRQVVYHRLLPQEACTNGPYSCHVGAPPRNPHTRRSTVLLRDERCRHHRGCCAVVACLGESCRCTINEHWKQG
jgi:succinate dehydrogenase (ubiquinone) membrane anchor subunit